MLTRGNDPPLDARRYSGSVTHCQPPVSSCTAHQEGSRRVGQLGG